MHYYKNTNFKIAFTGIMFALVLLFQYLEKFMPFAGTYLNINMSLIFIAATAYVVNYKYAFLLLLLRFGIGPALGKGYTHIEMWGQFILLSIGFIYLILFIFIEKLLSITKKMKRSVVRALVASTIATIFTSVVGALLNGLFFSPVYWWIMGFIDVPSIINAKKAYSDVTPMFFGIKNYWAGVMIVYTVGNLVKYSIVSIGFISIWKTLVQFIPNKADIKK